MRGLISARLNPHLLKSLRYASGSDFQAQAGSVSIRAGVLVLGYANDSTAKRMETVVKSLDGYFHHSKFLTPFVAVSVSKYLIIVYSESGGDDRVMAILKGLPERFQKASTEIGLWAESSGQ